MTKTSRVERAGRSTRLTTRGTAMTLFGVLFLTAGSLLGFRTLVIAGAVLVLPPLLGWLSMRFSSLEHGFNPLVLTRYATPSPTSVGSSVKIIAVIGTLRPTGRAANKLHGISLSARTPHGLGSGLPLRAQFNSDFATVELTYSLTPSRRGEWPLGPLFATRTDVFGVARSRTRFTDNTLIRVWPQVLPAFSTSTRGAAGLVPSLTGAAEPSDEDSSLRVYEPGDDLRRVHWVSAAKHNEMMVRTSEGASLPPVALVLDLVPLLPSEAKAANTPTSPQGEVTEWAVTVTASLGIHLLQSGHATRLISTESGVDQAALSSSGSPSGAQWLRPSQDGTHTQLLDQLVPIGVLNLTPETDARRTAVLEQLAGQRAHGETMICVITPPNAGHLESCVAALRAMPVSGAKKIAFIATLEEPWDEDDPEPNPTASVLRDELVAGGWTATLLPIGSNLELAWQEALGAFR